MNDLDSLRRLARLYGIQPAYYDVEKNVQEASADSLLHMLRLLEAPVSKVKDVPAALRARRRQLWTRLVEPVTVAWDGRVALPLRIPQAESRSPLRCEIALEEGGQQQWTGRIDELSLLRQRKVEGEYYETRRLRLPFPVPWGYHRLTVELGRQTAETLVIAAPCMAWSWRGRGPEESKIEDGRSKMAGGHPPSPLLDPHSFWGVFVPLYALHGESSWGAGDFRDLEALMEWVSQQGGNLVATLPLLAWQSDISDDFSPYSPASRLFWNEFYLDVTRIPELKQSQQAQQLVGSAAFQSELDALRERRLVDYRHQMRLKHQVLELLAAEFFRGWLGSEQSEAPRSAASGGSLRSPPATRDDRREEFDRFCREHPEVISYARFRAVGHRLGRAWTEWPEPLKSGSIESGDYDEEVCRYHLYVQWQLHEQLSGLHRHAEELDLVWYLDYPLGTSRDGYDVWRNRHLFAETASGGAPPDSFFTKGQDWGFPPLRPEELRRQGYRYFIQSLRHHLQFARLLRVDHVMGLHRLFWIPHGLEPAQGAYVRYHSQELFAVLVLESHRFQAEIIGENLGTVPDAVNVALNRHGVQQMYVLQYEIDREGQSPVHPVPENAVASLNTHDMPQFAAFWTGLDVDDRVDLGLMTVEQARQERENRAALRRAMTDFLYSEGLLDEETLDPLSVLKASLAWLSGGPAHTILVNLEDLWEETDPQNTPGTFRERHNWQRKTRYSFEEFTRLPEVRDVLRTIDERRRSAAEGHPQ